LKFVLSISAKISLTVSIADFMQILQFTINTQNLTVSWS